MYRGIYRILFTPHIKYKEGNKTPSLYLRKIATAIIHTRAGSSEATRIDVFYVRGIGFTGLKSVCSNLHLEKQFRTPPKALPDGLFPCG